MRSAAGESERKLDPELKARWVAALRSGEFKQTTGTLKDSKGYCCLGVLCHVAKDELATKLGIRIEEADDRLLVVVPDGEGHAEILNDRELPLYVEHELGLYEDTPSLVAMNDGLGFADGKSFPEIADYIEGAL
ncbi:hypothetical protein [Enterovirga sp. CN4-39]|uniref:hypothetical protein n=1 Tax=Enterovirga sp. CN4-39 TaxID=3400910 RepID=UPI003C11DD3A